MSRREGLHVGLYLLTVGATTPCLGSQINTLTGCSIAGNCDRMVPVNHSVSDKTSRRNELDSNNPSSDCLIYESSICNFSAEL